MIRRVAVAILCAAAVQTGTAEAQIFNPFSFLASPLPRGVGSDDVQAGFELGLNPLDGTPTLQLSSAGKRGYLALGGSGDQAVRTIQDGRHVGDLSGAGSSVYLLTPPIGRWRAEGFLQAGRQSGLLIDSGNRRTYADQRTTGASLRLTRTIAGGEFGSEVFLTYGYAASGANGATDALSGTLPIFVGAPAIDNQLSQSLGELGYRRYVSRRVLVEASFGRQDAPANVNVSQAADAVRLPLSTSGAGWSLGAKVDLGRDCDRVPTNVATSLSLWTVRANNSGSGAVSLPDGLHSGLIRTTDDRTVFGVALSRRVAAGGELTAFHTETWTYLDTGGFGIDALPLGFSSDTVNRVGYGLDVRLEVKETGVRWNKDLGRGQAFSADCRWITTPIDVNYDYTGQEFLFFVGAGGQWRVRDAQTGRIALSFALPLRRSTSDDRETRVAFHVEQIVPLTSISTSSVNTTGSSSSSGTAGAMRHISGGWTLGATLIQPF